jgi:hypothetical protein
MTYATKFYKNDLKVNLRKLAMIKNDNPPPTLSDLNTVNWSALDHARGKATKTPMYLKMLLSPSVTSREYALEELEDTICHQNYQIHESSLAALPFLFRLAVWPDMPQRAEIIKLIADIANGNGAYQGIQALEQVKKIFDGKDLEDKVAKEKNLQERIHAYIKSRKKDWIKFLQDEDSEVVENTLPLLIFIENFDDEIFSDLSNNLSHLHPVVQIELLLSLASHAGNQATDMLRNCSKITSGEVRLAAIVGLLHLRAELDEATIDDLIYFIEEHFAAIDKRAQKPESTSPRKSGFFDFLKQIFESKQKYSPNPTFLDQSCIEKVQYCWFSQNQLVTVICKILQEDYTHYAHKIPGKYAERCR